MSTLQLRNLRSVTVEQRVRYWCRRVGHEYEKSGRLLTAREMYRGPHLAPVRNLEDRRGGDVRVHVASAGLGLIDFNALIPAYSATFAVGDPDSVPIRSAHMNASRINQRWWALLTAQEAGRRAGTPTIASLATSYPTTPLLVALPQVYLDAVVPDLLLAASRLQNPSLLNIFVVGRVRVVEELHDYILPINVNLQTCVGGALGSLATRVLRRLLDDPDQDALRHTLKAALKALNRCAQATNRPIRQKLSDQEIMDFIRACLRENPTSSHSSILAAYRTSGFACERKRFKNIFMRCLGHDFQK